MSNLTAYEHGIYALDAGYLRPQLAAIHLIVEQGRAVLVDTGCNDSLPHVLSALSRLGVVPEQVDYVILTHIHLDHAGGAGALMRVLPNARLVVHPRGVRHMADPTQLIKGVAAVYGAEAVERLYGEILPIDAERIVTATDQLELNFAGRRLLCLETPGHAKHHIALLDSQSGHIFTGDVFGLAYKELLLEGRAFIFPTTSPVQFDPQALHASIDRIMSYQPGALYLTHFGRLQAPAPQALELHRLVDAHVAIARQAAQTLSSGAERHAYLLDQLTRLLLDETSRFGSPLPPEQISDIFANDLELNAQGLGVWLDQSAAAAAPATSSAA